MTFSSFIWKNLWVRRGRSFLTCAGVAAGVAAGVSMFAVARGFERDFTKTYAAQDTQMIVTGETKERPLPALADQRIGAELAKMDGVLGVAGALWEVQSLEGGATLGVLGWETGSYLWNHLIPRSGEAPGRQGSEDAVWLGQIAAGYLRKKAGDRIAFETGQPGVRELRVAGVFESASLAENAASAMRLDLLQSVLGCEGMVNCFNLHLDPQMTPPQFDVLRGKIQARFPNLNVMRADEIAENSAVVRAAKAMSIATTAIALLIGTLSVTNSVMMSVFERSHEIGLLMAVGWRTRRIAAMIALESLLLCLCGAAAGIVVAVTGMAALQKMEFLRGKFSADFRADIVLLAFLAAGAAGLLGAVYPAVLASRQQPNHTLREE